MSLGKTALQPTTNQTVKASKPHPVINATQSFQVCRHCKRPTTNREPTCVNCGTRSLRKTAAFAQTQIQHRFMQAFFTRATPVTQTLFFLNLILYALMAISAEGFWLENLLRGSNDATLLEFGAKTNLALQHGEFFRLLTAVFLHTSGLHIFSNSFALAIVGPQVERLYGSARFLVIYLLAGLGGLLNSTVAHALAGQANLVAVGASGAIFGLFGVLAIFSFKYRDELPAHFINAFACAVLPAIGVNLFIGFTVPLVDNSIPLGGLLAGVLLAFIIPYLVPGRERFTLQQAALMAGCVLVTVYCFTRAYQTSPHAWRNSEQASLTTAHRRP